MQSLPNKLYSVEQVRAMDRMAIEDYAIPGIDLMRKAGAVVFDEIQRHYASKSIVVLCGAGNNAGDGYVIAQLAKQQGINVVVYYVSDPNCLKGDAATAYQDYVDQDGLVVAFDNSLELKDCIVVDALLGTGIGRNVSGVYADAIYLINQNAETVISVDVPSGLNTDTGEVMGCAVQANLTVSFIGLKQGMFTGFAADYCGQVVFSDLKLPDIIVNSFKETAQFVMRPILKKRNRCSHKGNYGHVLVVGGDLGFSGAIKLAAEAALRIGAGLVSVATHVSHAQSINMTRPELMCHGVEGSQDLLPLLNKATVIVIGPGLGQSPWAIELLKCVVKTDKPLVVDADALNILANKQQYRDNWVLTPHPGEAARLLSCTTQGIANNRFLAISQLQKRYGGVVVLKGAGTLINDSKTLTVSTTGNPGMATGGMGDVLAGMIAGLIAQQSSLSQAAVDAVYLHGEAADLSSETEGEIGLLASDLMPLIRRLINR